MLSPDLVSDVLLRLRVKCLLRFRCVSKSFCAEIESADFVSNHLKRSTKTKTHQKLIVNKGSSFYAADFDDSLREITPLPLCCPLKYPQSVSVLCGGVLNGLILLGIIVESKFLKMRLILWNPFTQRYKNIPSYECTSFSNFNSFGIGYDSALDDYNIVMILKYYNAKGFPFPQVLVFSLKSNSWRRTEDAPLLVSSEIASTTGSALHWMCFDSKEVKILGFDVANEVFFSFQLLSGICPGVMLVLDGDLYVIRIAHHDRKTREFYLRVGDKDGDEAGGSWRKAFVLDEVKLNEVGAYLSWPLTYSKEGNNILLCNRNKFSWYNHDKETRQRIKINISGSSDYSYNVCSESLVSLGSDSAFDAEAVEVPVCISSANYYRFFWYVR